MVVTIVFLHNEKIYHSVIEKGQEVVIGSHKKSKIYIDSFSSEQVVIKWKKNGFSVNAKKAYDFEKNSVPLDTLLLLDKSSKTMLYLSSVTSSSSETLKLPYNCNIKFGRAEDNDVRLKFRFVSSEHFILKNEAGKVRVEDQGSTNGIFLNGKKVTVAKLKSGDTLSIFSIKIKLINGVLHFKNVGDKLYIGDIEETNINNADHANLKNLKLIYRRSPRIQDQLPKEDIILASAPTKAQKFEKNRGMFSALAGSGAMFAANMLVSSASPALLAARAASLVSPVASVASSKGANKKRKKSIEQYELLRREKYSAYIEDQKARIDSVAKVQRDILSRENPTPKECENILTGLKSRFWERTPSDRDFLDIRIGMGYENLCVNVKSRTDNNGFQMEDDEIRELSEQIIEETRIVDNVPARISLLRKNTIGFVGDRKKTIQLIKNMIISLSTLHCFKDVKVVGIFDEKEKEKWDFLKWMPHVWDDNHQSRNLAFNKDDAHNLCENLNEVLKKRKENLKETAYGEKIIYKPYYVFLFGSKVMVEKEELMNNLFVKESSIGATSLFLFDDMYMLPNDCGCIVDVDNGPCFFDKDEANNRVYFTMDPVVEDVKLDKFFRRMAAVNLEDFNERVGLPNGITFLKGYGVQTVEQLNVIDRWNSAVPYKSLAVPIGVLSGNRTFYFDIHEKQHGPHGLVAGTTGSGKSELLQTWILSTAINFHPQDVSFVIIDYKGGGMAKLLEPLPHVSGIITNLDGAAINRALVSIDSELKRRQKIFNDVGAKLGIGAVKDIYKYQEMYFERKVSERLPHLIIVSDEFAELKKEQPEFMTQLIRTARIGRSLGVHLVLATQKPGGVVDEQIQSNSRFRLCLKVQDVTDSREMIKRPDAANLTQAGRSYIRVGEDEYFDIFQSFWSGAPYLGNVNKNTIGNQVRIVDTNGKRIKTVFEKEKKEKNDLDEITVIVNYIRKIAQDNNIFKTQGPWLPELPDNLFLDTIKSDFAFNGELWNGEQKWLTVPIGKYDSPKTQTQGVQSINFSKEGHYGIYGAPGTGKTSLLKTIVLSLGVHYSPQDINIYILDCGGWSMSVFRDMPHVGGVILDSEGEKFQKFEKLIMQEFESRKRKFLNNSVGSIKAYREAISEDMPAIIIAVDNIVPIFELYPDIENLFVTIAREGATYGIYLIYTANSTSGVRYKVLQNIGGAISFELTDKGDYVTIVGRLDGMYLPKVTGRAFFKGNPPIEFQAALCSNGKTDKDKMIKIKKIISNMNSVWKGVKPVPIPVMPEKITSKNLLEEYTIRTLLPVGISCEDICPAFVDLNKNYSMLISGATEVENSLMLLALTEIIGKAFEQTKVFVFDSSSKVLEKAKDFVYKYIEYADDVGVSEALTEIVRYLNERKNAQNKARQIDDERFDENNFISDYELICIVVDDLKEFIDTISNSNKNTMERICRLAQYLGVIVLVSSRTEDVLKYNEIESLTQVIVANQNGIILNGTPAQHSYLQNNLKFTERDVEAGTGMGYLFAQGNCIKIKLIN